ncbi:MAG: iron-containing alcohol dehydrogenase [Anaerolineae bacterium]|nr:iron-containing alcohol dehydrogenase [Anaerolineae bacterium]
MSELTKEFRFHAPTQVQFGVGVARKLGAQAKRLGIGHAFLVTDAGLVDSEMAHATSRSLVEAGLSVTPYSDVAPDPDIASIQRGAAALRASGADGVVALGGGSAIDTAKAVAVLAAGGGDSIEDYFAPGARRPIPTLPPLVCLPTTAGTGAEVTGIAVVTDPTRGIKRTLVSPRVAPALALVDPVLTLTLPPRLTASTGMDALAHAVEAMTSTAANPISDALALAAVDLVGRYLVRAVEQGADLEARTGMSLAALLGGQAFPGALPHLGHAVGHALGTAYHLPHGLACAVALPAILDFIQPEVEPPLQRIAAALGVTPPIPPVYGGETRGGESSTAEQIAALYQRIGLPRLGQALGVGPDDLPRLADLTLQETDMLSRAPRRPTRDEWMGIFERSL